MGFIILRLENSLASFNKDNSANLFGLKKDVQLSYADC